MSLVGTEEKLKHFGCQSQAETASCICSSWPIQVGRNWWSYAENFPPKKNCPHW